MVFLYVELVYDPGPSHQLGIAYDRLTRLKNHQPHYAIAMRPLMTDSPPPTTDSSQLTKAKGYRTQATMARTTRSSAAGKKASASPAKKASAAKAKKPAAAKKSPAAAATKKAAAATSGKVVSIEACKQ